MDNQQGLPVQTGLHDTLREGLPCLKADASFAHPVEAILASSAQSQASIKDSLLGSLYGLSVPARMSIETQILSRPGRLPGLPSSRLGLDSLTGALDEFGFENYLGDPATSEVAPKDLVGKMEHMYGIGQHSKGSFA